MLGLSAAAEQFGAVFPLVSAQRARGRCQSLELPLAERRRRGGCFRASLTMETSVTPRRLKANAMSTTFVETFSLARFFPLAFGVGFGRPCCVFNLWDAPLLGKSLEAPGFLPGPPHLSRCCVFWAEIGWDRVCWSLLGGLHSIYVVQAV